MAEQDDACISFLFVLHDSVVVSVELPEDLPLRLLTPPILKGGNQNSAAIDLTKTHRQLHRPVAQIVMANKATDKTHDNARFRREGIDGDLCRAKIILGDAPRC